MNRKLALVSLSVLVLTAFLSSPLAAQPQYYNYNTNGNNNSFPFNMSAGKQVQLLYLPGDFNQPSAAPAGSLASISFRIGDTYPLGPWTYTDLTIKMGQASITDLTGGDFYTGPLTTVYYKASVLLSASGGTWLTIPLDTPFAYDPTQSLIVDVSQCGAPNATGFSACFTTLTGNRRNWSVGGCPLVYSSVNTAVYHVGITYGTVVLPPTVSTAAATLVTAARATLNGTVNANGNSTAVTFEYGLTTSYGSSVTAAQSPVTGTIDTPVSALVTFLLPNTTYHYRVVGVSSGGTSNGADMTFVTAAAVEVPTLSGWGMILLVVLMGLGSVYYLRRRRPTAQETIA
jgi:hypothetical protein